MFRKLRSIAALGPDRAGNIGIMAAASTAIVIGAMALGVDYGHLTLERRSLQDTSDLAAIVAASSIDQAEPAVLSFYKLNGKRLGIMRDGKLITSEGEFPATALSSMEDIDGYSVLTKGRYTADLSIPVENRFVAGAMPYDAVSVTTTSAGELFFAKAISTEPQIAVKSLASQQRTAAFSVGSRLASLNGGILNQVLGALLGTNVTLSVMDYNALLDADVELFSFTQALATELKLTGVTYEELLQSEISLGSYLSALASAGGGSPSASAILSGLSRALGTTQANIPLEKILSLEPYKALTVGKATGLTAKVSAFELLNAAAAVANGGKQVALDLGATVPGLASVKVDLAVGEPPVGTPFLAVGEKGTIVRTAQTRVKITASVSGLSALAGTKISVPIYVEVANAEAALSDIICQGGDPSNAIVKVKAVPGVAEIAIGNVDAAAFNHFASPPRVTKATIVDTALLKVAALGHAYASNISPDTLAFSPQDIRDGEIQSVSTRDTLTTLTTTLLGNLEVDIKVLILTLGTPKAVQIALADTLATLTKPLDVVLYNTLLTLGIRIGEADVRVTGVTCRRPVLVQ
ncbi:hypothetical protein IHQ71_16855 [Rhizobium sp. TH2]|uniref:pilus assembly protein TadG-related protein n=1 Tax=Rhizobium sp. TH2 TaxID=2775403 RepID=UPI002157E5E5|nr:pilus assembly protein TadG-related protein [Rhizobium sp. TH2]UVC06912.1 hypothetical protein IHQ71_16855 [Rhizobium sp. TH2]